jgi:hypothetical protein
VTTTAVGLTETGIGLIGTGDGGTGEEGTGDGGTGEDGTDVEVIGGLTTVGFGVPFGIGGVV